MRKQTISPVNGGLLVGCNYYADPLIPSLRFAAQDATELYEVLKQPLYGFRRARLRLLRSVDARQNQAGRLNILRHLKQIASQGQVGELLLFYYAGHGISIRDVPYICPSDVENDLLEETSIPLPKIREIVAGSRASVKLLIFDACHVGVSLDKGDRAVSLADIRSFQEQARDIFSGVKGIAMLAASSLEEVAKEVSDKRHGVFTWFLLEALKDLYRLNQIPDNHITVTELFHYVAEHLMEEYGQEATILLEGSGDLPVFALPPRSMPLNPIRRVFPQPVKTVQDFFGRDDVLQKVYMQLISTPDILIFMYGDPGIGKTSFLNRLKIMLDKETSPDIRFIHFSIEPGSLSGVADLARELRDGLIEAYRKSTKGFSWDRRFIFDSYSSFTAELENMLSSENKTRFVIFLDDAEKLFDSSEKLLYKQVMALISYIIQRTDLPIAFVLSTFYGPERFFMEYGSPPPLLYVYLDPLARRDSDAMLNTLLPEGLESREELFTYVYRLSGGYPYLVKLLASIYWEMTSKQNARGIDWGYFIDRAVANATHLCNFIYQNVFNEDERFVILSIAAEHRFHVPFEKFSKWKKRFQAAARRLERRFYLFSLQDDGYRLRMELLGEWLRRWPEFSLECERLGVQGELLD